MNEFLQRYRLLNNSRNRNQNEKTFLDLATHVTGPEKQFCSVMSDLTHALPTTLKWEAKI